MSLGPPHDSDRFEIDAPHGRSHNTRPFTHLDHPDWYTTVPKKPTPLLFRYPLTAMCLGGLAFAGITLAIIGWKLFLIACGVVLGALLWVGLWEWFRGKR